MLFIHVPCRCDSRVRVLQLLNLIRLALDTTEIEYRNIDKTKPLVADVKTEYVAGILVGKRP